MLEPLQENLGLYQAEIDAHNAMRRLINHSSTPEGWPTSRTNILDDYPYLQGFSRATTNEIATHVALETIPKRPLAAVARDGAAFAIAKFEGHTSFFIDPPDLGESIRDPEITQTLINAAPLRKLVTLTLAFLKSAEEADAYDQAKSEPTIFLSSDEQLPIKLRQPFHHTLLQLVPQLTNTHARSRERGVLPVDACQRGARIAIASIATYFEALASDPTI